MRLITNPADLPRTRGLFVPTMGALHAGHAALVRAADAMRTQYQTSPPIIISIFINPTQFNDPKDLARYPRTLEADINLCEQAGGRPDDIIFAPEVETIYPSPPKRPTPVPPLPKVATEPRLEDAHRPGHFAGVCQVVARLFQLINPAAAIFGEKDWQQLQVIRAMTAAARAAGQIQPDIIAAPTIREAGGLAMSSRNIFLSPAEREQALALSQALCDASAQITPAAAEQAMRSRLESAGLGPGIQYAAVRHAETLQPLKNPDTVPTPPTPSTPYRALIATKVGSIRLIDNAAWPAR